MGIEQTVDLKGLLPDELEDLAVSMGMASYRGRQIAAWLYGKGTTNIDEMTNLSKEVRNQLKEQSNILNLHPVKEVWTEDRKTAKYLFELPDRRCVETVLMWDGKRRTVCISSQVGCPLDYHFCATGKMGLVRDLTAGEILGQLIWIRRFLLEQGDDVTNVVMMGMGEPLLNYDQVVRAIRLMNLSYGPQIGIRRITLSTVGHVPGILRLSEEGLKIGLAISLNAWNDVQRDQIMPINKRWPIAALLDAARIYQQNLGRRITFEYVLLHGFNDSREDAHRLVELVKGIPCKINVIPWNPIDGEPFRRPPRPIIEQFVEIIADACMTATVRYSKGDDIAAGCGQLFQAPSLSASQSGPAFC